MIRYLKTLGLALVAVLAMSAVMASAASASQFTCSAYPCTAAGSSPVGNKTFTMPGGTLQCATHYLVGKVGGGQITEPSSTVTVTTTFSECRAFGFLNATVHKNGCDHVLHSAAQVSAGVYNHSQDVVCPLGSPGLVITAGACVVDVPPQTGLTNTKTTNLGGTVTAQTEIGNLTINVTVDGFGCPFPGPGHYIGSYHGDVNLSRVDGGSISTSGS
jgi:hypothetical protein